MEWRRFVTYLSNDPRTSVYTQRKWISTQCAGTITQPLKKEMVFFKHSIARLLGVTSQIGGHVAASP